MELRPVEPGDLPALFEVQRDAAAHHLAAFTSHLPDDREGFMSHAGKVLEDRRNVWKAVLVDGKVVGSVSFFELLGLPSVAYWIRRDLWGKGIATSALEVLLTSIPTRPVYARVVEDNLASLRVLEKCGFLRTGSERAFAPARGAEVEEWLLRRDSP